MPTREDDTVIPHNAERDSAWSVPALKEYILSLIQTNDTKYNRQFESAEAKSSERFTSVYSTFNQQLIAQKEAINAALAAADRAIQKAEAAAEKRFDNTNEWRQTIIDRDRILMPRAEAELMIRNLSDTLQSILKKINDVEAKGVGKAQAMQWVPVAIACTISALSAIGTLLLVYATINK